MRHQLLKLTKGHSTKAERRFAEILKNLHIKFQTRVKIQGREVDFLIGDNIIELNGHNQDPFRNKFLLEKGYNVFHFSNWDIGPHLNEWLKRIK